MLSCNSEIFAINEIKDRYFITKEPTGSLGKKFIIMTIFQTKAGFLIIMVTLPYQSGVYRHLSESKLNYVNIQISQIK